MTSAKSSSLASRAAEPVMVPSEGEEYCLSGMVAEWRPDGKPVWEKERGNRGSAPQPLGAQAWPDYRLLDSEFDHGAQGHMVSAKLTVAWNWEGREEYAFVMCDFDLREVTSVQLLPLIGSPTPTPR